MRGIITERVPKVCVELHKGKFVEVEEDQRGICVARSGREAAEKVDGERWEQSSGVYGENLWNHRLRIYRF
jgi:hypothetical protein